MEHRDVVERFLGAHFPHASIAVVGGSTSTGTRTATSDIDLLIIGDDVFPDDRQSLAAGFAFEGEFFEVFAYTYRGFTEWARQGVAQFRPVILHILIDGVEIRGGTGLAELREQWAPTMAAGPAPEPHQLAFRRYVITDLLDDLRDATDPLERHVVAALLFERTAELMLLGANQWIGSGKHLPRRLRQLDSARAEALSAPLLGGDIRRFVDRVEIELVAAGGRVQAGFER